jgi:hypothetical protein
MPTSIIENSAQVSLVGLSLYMARVGLSRIFEARVGFVSLANIKPRLKTVYRAN